MVQATEEGIMMSAIVQSQADAAARAQKEDLQKKPAWGRTGTYVVKIFPQFPALTIPHEMTLSTPPNHISTCAPPKP